VITLAKINSYPAVETGEIIRSACQLAYWTSITDTEAPLKNTRRTPTFRSGVTRASWRSRTFAVPTS